MNHARIAKSSRLRRLLKVLQQAGKDLSTFELVLKARNPAISASISELRANGAVIRCRKVRENGRFVHYYRLISSPEHPHEKTPH